MKNTDKTQLILIAEPENYSPKAISILKKIGQVVVKSLSKKEFNRLLPKIDILILRLGFKIDKKFMDQCPNLKVVGTNTTGLNHVDVMEAEKRGIEVISLRGHTDFLKNIHATPELTFGLILSLIRNIPWAFDSVKNLKWDRNSFAGNELFGKTLGILGFGRIGKIIIGYAKAFGMNVIACDPKISEKEMKRLNVKKVSQKDLFSKSDIVSIHVLHTKETEKLVQEKDFKLMKSSALFINTARGELVDENTLLKALKSKHIAGAALDVMRDEDAGGKHLKNNPLIQYAKMHKNLIIVPHIGGAAFEAWQATEEYLANLVVKFFKNKI